MRLSLLYLLRADTCYVMRWRAARYAQRAAAACALREKTQCAAIRVPARAAVAGGARRRASWQRCTPAQKNAYEFEIEKARVRKDVCE